MYRILELNPQLQYYSRDIDLRMERYFQTKYRLLSKGQTLNEFANAHNYYGFHHVDGGWVYREWAPSAYQLYLEGEFNKKVDELKTSYDDLSASYAVAMKKLDEYEAKEAQAKAEQHEADVKAMFEKYAEKLGKCSEFLVYKAKCNPADVTVDELNEKLTLMVGKHMMETQTKKSFSYNPTETKVTNNNNDAIASKYGHLLDKYIK